MKQSKRLFLLSLAIVAGLGGVAATALAQGDTLVVVCYHNRTIRVPFYLINRYLAVPGTTTGPCMPTQP